MAVLCNIRERPNHTSTGVVQFSRVPCVGEFVVVRGRWREVVTVGHLTDAGVDDVRAMVVVGRHATESLL